MSGRGAAALGLTAGKAQKMERKWRGGAKRETNVAHRRELSPGEKSRLLPEKSRTHFLLGTELLPDGFLSRSHR